MWLFLTTASHAASQQALVEGAKREREPLHPNAARLYVDFVLSKEGQAIMRGFHRLSARTDLMQEQAGLMKGLRIVPVDPALADQIDDYARLLREIFSR